MKIEATYCNRCKKTVTPPREICPYCGNSSESMERVSLVNYGVIVSYTTLNTPPDDFASPVRLALVKLEKEALVLCLSKNNASEAIEIGSEVELTQDEEQRYRYHIKK